jgi:NAD(P)-dependent dehydrogenase (short-subunit alcohol dehydrogenase family)
VLSLITGVGRKGQVGEAVAAALAARGDTVLLVSRSEEDVSARAADIIAAGGVARGYGCDLGVSSEVDRLAARVREEFGEQLDSLVNLAGGFAATGPLAQSDSPSVDRMWAVNAVTAFNATRALFPMLRAARGSVVFFASDVVLDGARTSGIAGYAMAKSAVVTLMRSVADEGREFGVRANALAPGSIRTGTNEASMGSSVRYVEREDVASAVEFLCSPAARAVTGQVIRLR